MFSVERSNLKIGLYSFSLLKLTLIIRTENSSTCFSTLGKPPAHFSLLEWFSGRSFLLCQYLIELRSPNTSTKLHFPGIHVYVKTSSTHKKLSFTGDVCATNRNLSEPVSWDHSEVLVRRTPYGFNPMGVTKIRPFRSPGSSEPWTHRGLTAFNVEEIWLCVFIRQHTPGYSIFLSPQN